MSESLLCQIMAPGGVEYVMHHAIEQRRTTIQGVAREHRQAVMTLGGADSYITDHCMYCSFTV